MTRGVTNKYAQSKRRFKKKKEEVTKAAKKKMTMEKSPFFFTFSLLKTLISLFTFIYSSLLVLFIQFVNKINNIFLF